MITPHGRLSHHQHTRGYKLHARTDRANCTELKRVRDKEGSQLDARRSNETYMDRNHLCGSLLAVLRAALHTDRYREIRRPDSTTWEIKSGPPG